MVKLYKIVSLLSAKPPETGILYKGCAKAVFPPDIKFIS